MIARLRRPAFATALVLGFALSLFSCASAPVQVPEDMSYEEIVQRAQEASDAYRYSVALDYYFAALQRFGGDPAIRVACDYEVAFIQYKMGDYAESARGLSDILSRYESAAGASLPRQYGMLASKVLPDVLEKLKAKSGE